MSAGPPRASERVVRRWLVRDQQAVEVALAVVAVGGHQLEGGLAVARGQAVDDRLVLVEDLLRAGAVTGGGRAAVGECSGGLRAMHTPGHSPGHIALFHEPSRTALLGDAVFHRGELALGPAALAADPDLRAGAPARLPGDLRAAGFAHGAPLSGAGIGAFHRFLDALAPAR